ncbi:MAG: capsular biosynthesis protein [Gammaproteobacteria bacterium]|nr:capsular biosynthesis protein [Gammaproteobacteria bacterium]
MKKLVCIALSKKRQQYFHAITDSLGDKAKVIFAGKPKLAMFRGLVDQLPNESALMSAHFARQKINHPKLSSMKPLWWLIRRFVLWYERCRYFNYLALFTGLDTKAIGIWNGQKQPYLTIAEAARAAGKRVLYFENGVMPNTTTIDYQGVNAANSLPRDAKFYQNWQSPINQNLPNQLVPYQKHKRRTDSGMNVELPKYYVFVPFQIPSDSQIVSQSTWITSMERLFSVLIEVNCYLTNAGNKPYSFVFKEHPAWPRHFKHLYQKDKNMVFANETNTQTLIEKSIAVLTINSTVGSESLLFNKRVITVGDAYYNIEGLVKHADNQQQLNKIFIELEHWQSDPQLTHNFLKFVYFNYCIPNSWQQPDTKHIHAAQQRILETDNLSRLLP